MKRICLLALALLHGAVAADSGWDLAAEHRIGEAHKLFAAASSEDPSSRNARLGQAVTLCNLQPVTAERLEQADLILTNLAATRDEIGIAAIYLRGRIAQSHRNPVRPREAEAHYIQLTSLDSNQPLAQAGVVQLALLILYDGSRPLLQRFAEAEALSDHLRGSFARSDYHLVLARSYLFHRASEDQALTHLEAAIHHGIRLDQIRADALVSAGELARKLHQPDQARRYYTQFLEENPRDSRHPTIQSRCEALP